MEEAGEEDLADQRFRAASGPALAFRGGFIAAELPDGRAVDPIHHEDRLTGVGVVDLGGVNFLRVGVEGVKVALVTGLVPKIEFAEHAVARLGDHAG